MTVLQTWDPAQYARHAHFVPELGAGVLELLAPRPGERILDLGCGDGVLTERIAAVGCEVIGVDASAQLAAAARARGLVVVVARAEELAFDARFDAVFSNAALHWMKQPEPVLEGVWRALRPGGRFVAELGGLGCVATIREAIALAMQRRGLDAAAWDPWYFPSADEYAALLARAGFELESAVLFPRPTPLPTDIEGWLATFAQSFLAPIPLAERSAFVAELRGSLEAKLHERARRQGWVADYVRLRFRAYKPASSR